MRAALVLILAIAHAIAQRRGPLFEPAPGSPFAVGASP